MSILKPCICILFLLLITSCQSREPETLKTVVEFPTAEFALSNGSDTTIFGEQGTRIYIPKDAFVFEDGSPVTGPVQIKLLEFYKKSDIILAGLNTVSNGKMLESGGMLNVRALSGGRELMLRDGKSIVVHFPKKRSGESPEMQLFYSSTPRDTITPESWVQDSAPLIKRTIKIFMWSQVYPAFDDSTEFNFAIKSDSSASTSWNDFRYYSNSFPFTKSTLDLVDSTIVNINFIVSKNGSIRKPAVEENIPRSAEKELLEFIRTIPAFIPGRNKYGQIIERECGLGLTVTHIPVHQGDAEYIRSFEQKYSRGNQSVESMNEAELEYYIFSVSKLGWINCDRFYEVDEKVDYVIDVPDDKLKLQLVFSDIKSVMVPVRMNGKLTFPRVPKNRKAKLIASKNSGGKFETSFQDVVISSTPLKKIELRETTLADFRKELENLN